MFKTFFLTAALATSAFVGGYYADDAINAAFELRSYMQTHIDPEAAFWECWNAHADAATCKPQADAWAARDGRAYVMRKAAGVVLADSLTKSLAPAR